MSIPSITGPQEAFYYENRVLSISGPKDRSFSIFIPSIELNIYNDGRVDKRDRVFPSIGNQKKIEIYAELAKQVNALAQEKFTLEKRISDIQNLLSQIFVQIQNDPKNT